MKHIGNLVLTLTTLVLVAAGCTEGDIPPPEATEMDQAPGIVEITARGLTFDAPSEIPSGWTTIRFNNESNMVHFALLERLPDGKTVRDQQEEVAPVFQDGMDRLRAGDQEGAMETFGQLPAWFGDIVMKGGPGLTAGGRASEVTVYLEPGIYMVECYVKTNGVFHSYNPDPLTMGMVAEITVTEENAGLAEPTPTEEMTISSDSGIVFTGDLEPGEHTIAVRFEDQTQHENFVGHDVHLARIAESTDLDALETWMNWTLPDGLQTPAPVEFVGGTNELPAGETGYVTVTLEPGRYAWIAEVPNAREKGMLVEFEVGSAM